MQHLSVSVSLLLRLLLQLLLVGDLTTAIPFFAILILVIDITMCAKLPTMG